MTTSKEQFNDSEDPNALRAQIEGLMKEVNQLKTENQKLDSVVSLIFSSIFHDLRNPLNGIIGFSELLKLNPSPDKLERYSGFIINSSRQLLRTMNNLLYLARLEAGLVEPHITTFSLKTILEIHHSQTKNLLDSNPKTDVKILLQNKIKEEDDLITTDEEMLRTIIDNILENSSKFTYHGLIDMYCVCKNKNLEITIKDTGIGIVDADLPLVYNKFFQSESISDKYGGLGIGLYICKGFIDLLGGTIKIESVKNQSTSVCISIPYKNK